MSYETSTGSVSRTIEAKPTAIYELLTDVGRMGEWSPECVSVEVADAVAVGTTFTGHNERGGNEWSTGCTVIVADPASRFAFVAGDDPAVATTWTYQIVDLGDGTSTVTESFDAVRLRHPDWAAQLAGRRDQLVADMTATLDALAAAVEA